MERIDFADFFRRLTIHQESIEQVKNRSLVMMIGRSGVGKSSLGCFLIGRTLALQERTNTSRITGKVRTETVVVTMNPQPGDFSIGHGTDSQTKCITSIPLAGYPDILLGDTCGFWDPENSKDTIQTTNIVNAIGLRNVMRACSEFRAILLIDMWEFNINRAEAFVEFVSLLVRFFNPISSFLESMVVYLRPHGRVTQDDLDQIANQLEKLFTSDNLQDSPDHLAFIHYLATELEDRQLHIFFEYTPPDEARNRIIQSIVKLKGFTQSYCLGCPLSNESMSFLCNQIRDLIVETNSNFQQQKYEQVHANYTYLTTLQQSLPIHEINELFDQFHFDILEKINQIKESATHNFDRLDFLHLRVDLLRLRDLKVIEQLDLQDDYTDRILKLNDYLKSIGSQFIDKAEIDPVVDPQNLEILYQMKLYLSNFLHSENVDLYGYDTVCQLLTTKIAKLDLFCSTFLSSLKQVLAQWNSTLDFKLFFLTLDQLRAGMALSEHITTIDARCLTEYDLLLIQQRLELTNRIIELCATTTSLVFPQNEPQILYVMDRQKQERNRIPQNNGTDLYQNHRSELRSQLNVAMECFLCLLTSVQDCSLTVEQSNGLTFLHSLLEECCRWGVSSHLSDSSELCNLDSYIVGEIIRVLGNHLSVVDDLYSRASFVRLVSYLRVLGLVHLNHEKFAQFKTSNIEAKLDILARNISSTNDDLNQQIELLENRKVIEEADVKKVISSLSQLKAALPLLPYLFPNDENSSLWYTNSVKSLSRIWCNTQQNFLLSLVSADSSLVRSLYSRLDRFFLFASTVVPEAENHVKIVFSDIEKKVQNLIRLNPDTLSPSVLQSNLDLFINLDELISEIEISQYIIHVLEHDLNWCELTRSKLIQWVHEVQESVSNRMQILRQEVMTSFAAYDPQKFAVGLNQLKEFCLLDESLEPKPSLLYLACLSEFRSSLTLKCDSARHRNDLVALSGLRSFISSSYLYQSHFEGIRFEDYVVELQTHHRNVVDQMDVEVEDCIKKKRYPLLKRKLALLKSSTDQSDEEMYSTCDSLVANHFQFLKASVDQYSGITSSYETLDGLIKLFENCHETVVLSDVVTMKPKELVKYAASCLSELFLDIKNAILADLSKYRYREASTQFTLLKIFRRCDLTFGNYQDLQECTPFTPQIESLWKENILTIPDSLVESCENYCRMKIEEMNNSDALDTSNSNGSLSENLPDILPSLSRDTSLNEDDSFLDHLLLSVKVGCETTLFERRVDFEKIKKKITQILSFFIHSLVRTMQEQIYRMNLGAARTREKAGSVVVNLPNIEYFLPSQYRDRFALQIKSLEAAEQTGLFSHFRFHATDMPNVKKHLDDQRRRNFQPYMKDYLTFKNLFIQEYAIFTDQLNKLTSSKDVDFIFQFMIALELFDETIVDRKMDAESQRYVSESRVKFDEFLNQQLCSCQKNLKKGVDVKTTHSRLVALRVGLVMFSSTNAAAKDKDKWDDFIKICTTQEEAAATLLSNIALDRKVLGSHDLFVRQDMDQIIQKLDRLSRQKAADENKFDIRRQSRESQSENELGFDEIKSNLEGQLVTASDRVRSLLDSAKRDDYESCVNGILNIRDLGRFPPLRDVCISTSNSIHAILVEERNRLSELVVTYFRSKDFKKLDNTIILAASFEEDLLTKINRSGDQAIPLLMFEVLARFESEMNGLSERALKMNSPLEVHAEVLLTIKKSVSEISQSDIQALAFKHIGGYLAALAKKKVDIHNLGKILSEGGPLGIQITEQYPQFKAIIAKRRNQLTARITYPDAVSSLVTLNKLPASASNVFLKFGESFHQQYEANLRMYLQGYGSFEIAPPLDRLVDDVSRRAQLCATNPTPDDLIYLLAGIFATWTVLSSSDMFSSSSNDQECITKPHPVQLIAIFRLIGIDNADGFWKSIYRRVGFNQALEGHLIQVGTGEGKSVLLGAVSCLLALFGYDVYCASYSRHLSERDHAAFTPLFDRYSKGVGKIHYGTLNDLVEEVLNESGDLRQLALNTLTGHRSTSILPSNTRKVLLIDEVDVFFSENFYGQTYNPVAYFSSEETIAMMNHIWTTRSSVRLSDIQQLPSYRGLIQRFSPEVTPLIDQHIRMMIEDAKDFNNPPYTVTPDGKNIGYVIGDSMETELLSFDYRTPFAYLHEVSRHPAMNETIPTVLAIQIPCGRFSYAEIPLEKTLNAHQKPVFECILGVTGTLDCLSQEECRIVEEEYKIKARTICPSMFGVSKVDFKPDRDVILAPDKNAHFQVILDKIIEMLRVDRPVIVYFDSATTLKSFYSKYENQLETITVNIVDENTTNIDFFVNKATESRIVTLLTRSFGRGLDFQSRDEAVETAGGVGVLQTFFSLYLSEQIQTKGRTGRQTKKGTFQIILEATSLAKQLERPVEEIINAGKSESFYQTISTYRETLVTKHIQSLRTRSADARRVHQESVAFLRKLRTGIPVSDAIRAMTTFQGTQTVSNGAATVHNIFCLDASGSMRDSWNDVAQAVNQFLAVRKELGGAAGDLVTVLQFSTAPKFILEHVNLEQALKTNLSNTCRGETNYVPALLKCLEVIQNDRSGLEPVIVFMTDGAPTDNNKEEIVPSVRQLKDAAPNLQFFCVAFNCGLGGHLEEMTNAIDGRPVSAQGVDQLKNEFKTIARQVSAKHGKRK